MDVLEMDELMFNCVGQYDPMLMKSLTEIEKRERKARRAAAYRPLVYICSPYAGDVENNTARARVFCRFAVIKKAIPIAPHLLFPQFMSEERERRLVLFMGMVLLGKCDEVWVFGERISEGMLAEIEKAKKMWKKIRYFNGDISSYSFDSFGSISCAKSESLFRASGDNVII